MKSTLKTLHKLREMRKTMALSRVNEQDAVVAESAGAMMTVEQELRERVWREQEHRRAMSERAMRGNACAGDMVYGRLHAAQLQQQTIETGGKLLDMEHAHRVEEETAQILRGLLQRADAEVQSIEKAEERLIAAARRRAEQREEDAIDEVSLTRHTTRRR